MPSTPTVAFAHADHRQPFVARVVHEDQGGHWAHVEVYQVLKGRPFNVTPSIAQHLVAMGANGQVAGGFHQPAGLRLVVGMDRNSPAMLISALTMHLSRCARAMNSTFKAVVRDDTVADGPWTPVQQQRLDAALNTATHRATRTSRPRYEPVDYALPMVYRIDQELDHGRVAHVRLFQDRRDQRVEVTHALADHLMALDAVGQVTGNFMTAGDVRLVAVARSPVEASDALRFEDSLRHTVGRCANAMGARLQPLRREDLPAPALAVDEFQDLMSEAQPVVATARAPRSRRG